MSEPTTDKLYDQNIERRKIMLKAGEIIVNTNFDSIMMERAYFELKGLLADWNIKEIKIYINSHGGDVFAMTPLVDLINSSNKKISTIILGKAYSCGVMLAMNGHLGYRYAHKHSSILVHEVANGANYAKNTQVQHDAKYLEFVNELLIKMIKDKTKMTQKDIDKYMKSNSDIFISAQEAKKLGIIDKII